MDFTLLAGAILLGLAGIPHCAGMCGAACAAALGRSGGSRGTQLAFHLARIASYAAAGAVAAASVGALSALGQLSPALKPLWTMVHVAALALGLWLLWQGRQPAWLAELGRGSSRVAAVGGVSAAGGAAIGGSSGGGTWQVMRGPLRGGAAGALWVAWPCGLLQSALVVAALANTAAAGAAVMAGFALVTAAGIGAGPWIWQRLGGGAASARAAAWAARLAGLMLATASGWALGHGLWHRALDYCFG
jgi:hypothetical protein